MFIINQPLIKEAFRSKTLMTNIVIVLLMSLAFSRCRNIIGDWLTDNNIFNARAGAFANLVWDRLQISETVYQISISFADGSVSVFRIDTVSTDDFGARKNRYFINYKKNSSKDKLDNDIPESINDIKSQGFVVHQELA